MTDGEIALNILRKLIAVEDGCFTARQGGWIFADAEYYDATYKEVELIISLETEIANERKTNS